MPENLTTTVSSATQTVEISRDRPTVIIGERINPTGRKKVLTALQTGNFDVVRQDARKQVAAGAAMLDVNAGVPGADGPALLRQVMQTVMEETDAPLCIDTADVDALATALAIYPGKALVNSVNGEGRSLNAVLPLVKEHGAAVIGLCMDDDGIPDTSAKRLAVAAKIIEQAGENGYRRGRYRDRPPGTDHRGRPQRRARGAGNDGAGGPRIWRQHHPRGQQYLLWLARP